MKVEIETEDRHECTPCEYKDTKKKNGKYIRLEVMKVNQKKEKDQKFQGDKCEYKCSEKDTQEPYRRDWYKTKKEEIWLIRVCMYQKGYSESTLKYKSQRAGGKDFGMPLMW